jgi:hypothetical protein
VSSPQEIVTNEYVGIRSWPICGFGWVAFPVNHDIYRKPTN